MRTIRDKRLTGNGDARVSDNPFIVELHVARLIAVLDDTVELLHDDGHDREAASVQWVVSELWRLVDTVRRFTP